MVLAAYERRLRGRVVRGPVPHHVAIVMDGNRRWAKRQAMENVSIGHRYGADHVEKVLGWCADAGIRYVTVFAASADNLVKRSAGEMRLLMSLVEQVATEQLARKGSRWQVHLAGQMDILPESTQLALTNAVEATRDVNTGSHFTIAIGYDGRVEIVDALRTLLRREAHAGTSLEDLAQRLTADDIADSIAEHLHTSGQPDPDLVIRTSGERRLSGFLLWQSAHSQLYFCDVYWPAFRHVDFLRALRSYASRQQPA